LGNFLLDFVRGVVLALEQNSPQRS